MARRLVSLPRCILGGFSRAVSHGIDLMSSIGGRRYHTPPLLPPPVQEEWVFLTNFEHQFGSTHPFFYACHFTEALKIAEDEKKLVFMYLHSRDHPFTGSFCRETLCTELVAQFLDANFVSWGGVADRGEGLHMAATLRPASFPFCAVIAPAAGDSITVLQQIEGPVTPAELVEILQRTMEEQGVAFGSSKAYEEEKRREDRRLREEQNAAYHASLKLDQEKERLKGLTPVAAPTSSRLNNSERPSKVMEGIPSRGYQHPEINAIKGTDPQVSQILIRFPNGERREQSFSTSDKIQSIYGYIDSLGLPGIGNYRLVSNFPRKVYGADQMNMTLKDAGLQPRASLFLEVM
ncbi:hypothetical protein Nepgr_003105 [Nepenthes gracilis]|uniref:UBX domain-containing protein n=1 Tax=Nepenthes gracilis TaxID=150966 RepID=A0AAD3RYW1_NEPGR|nr:hypothetical protein Nepgr_003105 [Nepenthes gracilis]